jgi:hypothetical protein
MKLNNTYAFTKDNHVGQFAGKLQTPLMEGATVQGQPVVVLCQQDGFVPREDGSALVAKGTKGEWKPIASVKQLEETLANTPKEKLGEKVGIWTDARSHLWIKGKDGVPQQGEVQTLASHWEENAVNSSTRFDDLGVRNSDPNTPPQIMTVGWSFEDAHVRANEVKLESAAFPGKQVGVLTEPLYVDSHEVLRVTDFDDRGFEFIPTAVESTKNTPAGSKTTPNAKYDVAALLYDGSNAYDQVRNVIPG